MKYCNYCMILMTIISIVIIKVVHAAHGDNMLCEGCGAVMEHVYHDVLKYAEENYMMMGDDVQHKKKQY